MLEFPIKIQIILNEMFNNPDKFKLLNKFISTKINI